MSKYILASLISFFGFFIRGVSGFGSALVITPLLLFLYDLRIVVPVIAILEIVSTLYFTIEVLKEVDWKYIKSFVPVSLAGIIAGAFILVSYETVILKRILGVIVAIFAVRILILNILSSILKRKKWPFFITYLIGALAGVLAGLYGIGGPPTVIYLENQIEKKNMLRATLIFYFYFLDIVRVGPYIFSNMIGIDVLRITGIMLPASLMGMLFGRLVYLKIPDNLFRVFVGLVLFGSGILLTLY